MVQAQAEKPVQTVSSERGKWAMKNIRVILMNSKKNLNKMGYLSIFQHLVFNPFI